MVAVQVLLMNYFLLGLHHEQRMTNDVIIPDLVMEVGCGRGCSQCTAVNGCLSCKPPFFLLLTRDANIQRGSCTRVCPAGFYKLRRRRHKTGFCAKCMLRGCSECGSRHYCSVCKPGLVRYAGRCRKQCPQGTAPAARAPALCLPAPSYQPDVSLNEIAVGNGSSPKPLPTPRPVPTNATSTTPFTPTKKRKKKKRRKEKGKKRYRHRRRKYRMRMRNRRRKERRRRKMKTRHRRRKKLRPAIENVTTTTMAPGS